MQIVGPHGSGKSTLLELLRRELDRSELDHSRLGHSERSGRFEIATAKLHANSLHGSWKSAFRHSREMARLAQQVQCKLSKGGLLIVDGWEQLSWIDARWMLRRARRRNQRLLVTSHRKLRGFVTLYQTHLTRERVNALTDERIGHLSPLQQSLVQGFLESRKIDSQTNLRDLWFDCYDIVNHRSI